MATQYNRLAVVLHWCLALFLMLLLFGGSQMLVPLDNANPEKIGALQGHATFGVLVGVLTLIRLINILMRGKPANAYPAGTSMALVTSLGHKLLYVLVLAVVGSGIAMGMAIDLGGVFAGTIGLPESFNHLGARAAHGILTKLLAITMLGHIIAALYHQFVRKDKLMQRMYWKRLD